MGDNVAISHYKDVSRIITMCIQQIIILRYVASITLTSMLAITKSKENEKEKKRLMLDLTKLGQSLGIQYISCVFHFLYLTDN